MRREQSGLFLTAGSAPRTAGLRFPWGDMAVALVLAAGTCLLLRELFPSVTEPWWLLTLLMLPLCAALLLLYETKCGPWLLPSGALLLLLLFLACRTPVLSGFSCLGNDLLSLLTARTGRIYLDFAAADPDRVYWALIPLLVLCALLLSRAVWSGRLWLALPLLLPAYAAMLTGLAPCGVSCGLLTAGTVLLMMQHTAKAGDDTVGLAGRPVQLLLPLLCAALCLLAGLAVKDGLSTELAETVAQRIHERRYDQTTNSMPEGELKNLPAWNRNDTPALEITMEKPGKVYLRGQIYEVYTGSRWEAADTKDTAAYEELFYWLHKDGFYGQSQIGTASRWALTATEPLDMTVKNLTACAAHGYYPYALYGSGLLDAAQIGDTGLPAAEELRYLTGSVPEWYQLQRELASGQGRQEIQSYLELEQAYAAYVKAMDLQLTQESWSVVKRQLSLPEGSRTISEIRNIIYAYLGENLAYDETVRTGNGNGDFLQYTLEKSGRGYSVHYATAAVLMLRYMGVPARYVEGYYLSAEQAARYAAGEPITLTEQNAHAWAEYYVSGVGFVPFEVTPGYIDNEDVDIGASIGDGDAENTYVSEQQKFVEVEQPEEQTEQEQDRAVFSLEVKYLLWLLLLPVLALLILIIVRRKRLHRALRAIDEANDKDAIAMRYGYADCLLHHSTVQPPEGAAEAAALNREALFSPHAMNAEQRRCVDDYAARVLTDCKASWTLWQKIRYRLWNCLY